MVRVNVLPPAYLWAGDVMLDHAQPDPVHWTVYADGEIIARIARQEDVGAALGSLLTGGTQSTQGRPTPSSSSRRRLTSSGSS